MFYACTLRFEFYTNIMDYFKTEFFISRLYFTKILSQIEQISGSYKCVGIEMIYKSFKAWIITCIYNEKVVSSATEFLRIYFKPYTESSA